MLLFNLLGVLVVYAAAAAAGRAAAQPAGLGRGHARLVVQHRGQLRHQHQLAGLRRRDDDELPHADARRSTVQNFVSAATGMAVLVALIRGFARRTAQTIGNFWVDLTRRRSTSCCRSRSSSRWSWCRRAWCRPSAPTRRCRCVQPTEYDEPKLDADGKPVKDDKGKPMTEKTTRHRADARRWARPRRRSRSSSSAPTAAASSTSTRRIRSRTRRRSSNFLEMLAILLIPAALCYTFGVMVGDTRQGWALLAAMT